MAEGSLRLNKFYVLSLLNFELRVQNLVMIIRLDFNVIFVYIMLFGVLKKLQIQIFVEGYYFGHVQKLWFTIVKFRSSSNVKVCHCQIFSVKF